MQFEVEQKFAVPELADIETVLNGQAVTWLTFESHVDLYFNHPSRDFAETDEALRLRRVNERCVVTYKGPRLDLHTKTRRELELPLSADTFDGFRILLTTLGFRPVSEVHKQRRRCRMTAGGFTVELALDKVQGLGSFVELEIVVEKAQLTAAQKTVLQLADDLGLTQPERRSYLEMLLN